MKEKLRQYMQGRYGMDSLNRFLFGVAVVFALLSMLSRNSIFYASGMAVLLVSYVRMLSKNYTKRAHENAVYLKYFGRLTRSVGGFQKQLKQRKTHHIYRCPSCKQKLRIPRGKGKIMVSCPKCRTEFEKKSR